MSGFVLIGASPLRVPHCLDMLRQMATNGLRQLYVFCGATGVAVAAVLDTLHAGRDPRRGRQIVQEPKTVHRVSLGFGEPVFTEITGYANERNTTVAQIIRLSLGLFRTVVREHKNGNSLVVVSSGGKPLREVVLPRL